MVIREIHKARYTNRRAYGFHGDFNQHLYASSGLRLRSWDKTLHRNFLAVFVQLLYPGTFNRGLRTKFWQVSISG